VLAAHEASVVAREDRRLLPEELGGGDGGAAGERAEGLRVGAAASASASGRYITIAVDRSDSSGSSREPSSSAGIPNAAGSGSGAEKYASSNSPVQEVSVTNAAMPAPQPRSS
jgi:hypothetical protein